jgi:hypothetical protein
MSLGKNEGDLQGGQMLKDIGTEDGKRAMEIGEAWEAKLWEIFKAKDPDARWISKGEGDWLAGHDFIFKGKRVEVKTNEGTDKWGKAYDTCCLELETRGGNTIGWRQGKADVVLLVNRSQSMGYFFNAAKLKLWTKHSPWFWKHDARCTKVRWQHEDAGFMAEVEL